MGLVVFRGTRYRRDWRLLAQREFGSKEVVEINEDAQQLRGHHVRRPQAERSDSAPPSCYATKHAHRTLPSVQTSSSSPIISSSLVGSTTFSPILSIENTFGDRRRGSVYSSLFFSFHPPPFSFYASRDTHSTASLSRPVLPRNFNKLTHQTRLFQIYFPLACRGDLQDARSIRLIFRKRGL